MDGETVLSLQQPGPGRGGGGQSVRREGIHRTGEGQARPGRLHPWGIHGESRRLWLPHGRSLGAGFSIEVEGTMAKNFLCQKIILYIFKNYFLK